MKYLRTFENSKQPEIGDKVKYIKNELPIHFDVLPIYTITKIDNWAIKYKYYIEREEPGTYKYRWVEKDELFFIPEHELAAKKYNL